MRRPYGERQPHIEFFNKATSRFSASLLSAVSFWVPQMLSYGSAGVPAMPATISMSGTHVTNVIM